MNKITIDSTHLRGMILSALKYTKNDYSIYSTLNFISDNAAKIDKNTAIMIIKEIDNILNSQIINESAIAKYNDTVEQIMIEHFDKKENK